MKPLLLFFFSLTYFAACSSTQQTTDLTLPELLYQHPLPAFPKPITAPHLRIDLEILVTENGTVRDVRLLNSSGSVAWDSAAATAIRQWKYSPARYREKPVRIWLHQTAIVKFSEPRYLSLAEIMCTTTEEADSAYMLLEQGSDFSEIVLRYSVTSSREKNGALGAVNILIYPEQIKNILAKLETERYTHPVKYGERYVIFKRLKE